MEAAQPVDSDISSRDLAVLAAQALDEKLATDVVVLPVGDVLAITEYFVIASASNKRQVKSLADAVLTAVRDRTTTSP